MGSITLGCSAFCLRICASEKPCALHVHGATMRYEIRFNNGVYHIFDTHQYRALEAFGTLKDAKRKFDAPTK